MATPTITSLSKTTGNIAGGLLVTITGTGLDTADVATFGSNTSAVVGTPTSTTAVFRTPKQTSTGAVGVKVHNTATGDSAVSAAAFTYTKVPFGGSRGPTGAVVPPEDVYTQGDATSSVTKPAVLTQVVGQVQTQGSLGGLLGAIPDYTALERVAVVFGHPDSKALST